MKKIIWLVSLTVLLSVSFAFAGKGENKFDLIWGAIWGLQDIASNHDARISVLEDGDEPPVNGSDLIVTLASDTPESSLVPGGSRALFTKVTFTNTSDDDIAIDSFTVERLGLAQDVAFASIDLLDENIVPITESPSLLDVNHLAFFDDNLVINSHQSKSLYLVGNMKSKAWLVSHHSEEPILALKDISLVDSYIVSDTLPIIGNLQRINATLTLGAMTVRRSGCCYPATSTTAYIGSTDYLVSSIKIQVGSASPVSIGHIKFTTNGSALPSSFANLKLINADTSEVLGLLTKIDTNEALFDVNILLDKSELINLDLTLDIVDGHATMFSVDIDRKIDILAFDETYEFYFTPGYTGHGAGNEPPVLTSNPQTIANP